MIRPNVAIRAAICAVFLLAPLAAASQDQPAPPPPPPCTGDAFHQFDFWIGEWTVKQPDGTVAGTNRIERVQNGCALRESWTGASGGSGTSLNFYDQRTGKWNQTWVSSNGFVLQMSGGLKDGAMVLSGIGPSRGAVSALHRITWTPLPDGRVRQLWEASVDEGKTWSQVFDGYYSK